VSRLESALRNIASELDLLRYSWALIGGLAVSARVEPRFTRDIDLALAVSNDAMAEALVHRLVGSGYGILASIEQEHVGRLATVRLEAPAEGPAGVVVDLLFASSGAEAEVVRGADVLEVLPGLRVPVARPGHLLALKLLSEGPERPQDLADIVALLRNATPADLEETRQLAALISQRGYARGRDLLSSLDQHLRARPTGS
jgi:predicted nucleotidyltransferase